MTNEVILVGVCVFSDKALVVFCYNVSHRNILLIANAMAWEAGQEVIKSNWTLAAAHQ